MQPTLRILSLGLGSFGAPLVGVATSLEQAPGTRVVSYVNARMGGLSGQLVSFPMIRKGAFILSGYKGIDIWFAPIPYADHGHRAQLFREVELTGTRSPPSSRSSSCP
jgi:hypothetical protein